MKKSMKPEQLTCPLPITEHDAIQLSHGAGGKMMNELISKLFVWAFDNPALSKQDDQAVVEIGDQKLSFTTDSFVVDPIFFPGGDIGDLAINGTINDICMNGARPFCLSAGLIIEEGFPLKDLERIVLSMKRAADKAGVTIVTGDTKVVNKGNADKIFINTAGIGLIEHNHDISSCNLKPGDVVIISGTVADHGIAVMSQREGLSFDTPIQSDTVALNTLVEAIVKAAGGDVHAMRDPTRGGLAATLNEFARASEVGIKIREDLIPVKPAVTGACEILGLDPLYVANEGKLVAVVAKQKADSVLKAMQGHELGRDAVVIGEIDSDRPGMVSMMTRIGGQRIVDMPVGEQLPRIC